MRIRHENRVKLLFPTFLIVISSSQLGCSQPLNAFYHQKQPLVINNVDTYKDSVHEDSANLLVSLQQYIPQLVIDLKYGTKNNFTHQVLYQRPTAFARLPTAQALKKINADLKEKGLGLVVFDAYRPYTVTKKMWKVVPDERYAANPAKGSGHNRGASVDVSLVKLSTGEELKMPTAFDNFSEKAHHNYMKLPAEIIANRNLLKSEMEKYGFVALTTEWWHYSLPNAADRFQLMDLSFEQLEKVQAEFDKQSILLKGF